MPGPFVTHLCTCFFSYLPRPPYSSFHFSCRVGPWEWVHRSMWHQFDPRAWSLLHKDLSQAHGWQRQGLDVLFHSSRSHNIANGHMPNILLIRFASGFLLDLYTLYSASSQSLFLSTWSEVPSQFDIQVSVKGFIQLYWNYSCICHPDWIVSLLRTGSDLLYFSKSPGKHLM